MAVHSIADDEHVRAVLEQFFGVDRLVSDDRTVATWVEEAARFEAGTLRRGKRLAIPVGELAKVVAPNGRDAFGVFEVLGQQSFHVRRVAGVEGCGGGLGVGRPRLRTLKTPRQSGGLPVESDLRPSLF